MLTLSGVAAWAVTSGRLGGDSSGPASPVPTASPGTGVPTGEPSPAETPTPPSVQGPAVLYSRFREGEDTIWLAPLSRLEEPQAVVSVSHAPFWGISASLSPDGRWLAYTVLPPTVANPEQTASSAAQVWLAPLAEGEPRLLARGADVRLAPIWSPDGRSLIFQRLEGQARGPTLFRIDLADGQVSLLAALEQYPTAFPLAFAADGQTLYLVQTGLGGTELLALSIADGSLRSLVTLPTSTARDWRLSPEGQRMSFVALLPGEGWGLWTVDLRDGSLSRLEAEGLPTEGGLFSPVWHPSGRFITVGAAPDENGGGAVNVPLAGGAAQRLPGPEQGVDFPAGWSPGGELLVVEEYADYPPQHLPRLLLIDTQGRRQPVTGAGELTFIGWIGGGG